MNQFELEQELRSKVPTNGPLPPTEDAGDEAKKATDNDGLMRSIRFLRDVRRRLEDHRSSPTRCTDLLESSSRLSNLIPNPILSLS